MSAGNVILKGLNNLLSSVLNRVDSTIDKYVSSQERMTYGLIGTNRSLSEVTDNLQNALTTSSLVSQEAVYGNIQSLLEEGIVYNVEQRAFLATIANDMGAIFDPKRGSFPRLINLQRVDTSANRLALEHSLKEFLNRNYENSEYIKQSFQQVSDSLIEAQSLMNAQAGVELESVVQKWLGSLTSVGLSSSTAQSIATALGQLGSGNISALSGSNVGNLVIMGASQAGLSYADLLTRGLTAEDTDNLMRGIVQYIASMSEGSSNVVKSEYARIFGLNVSDIVAASNLGNTVQSGMLSTNINDLLSSYSELVPMQAQMQNILDNIIYTLGTNVASNTGDYIFYKSGKLIGDLAGQLADASGGLGGLLFGGVASAAKLGPLIGLIPSAIRTIEDAVQSSTGMFGNFDRTFADLGAVTSGLAQRIQTSGVGLDTGFTGTTTSAVIQYGSDGSTSATVASNANITDILKGARTSAMNREAEIADIGEDYMDEQAYYKMIKSYIDNSAVPFFNREALTTYTKIVDGENTVTIGTNDNSVYIQDMLTITAVNTENIFILLNEKFNTEKLEGATLRDTRGYWADSGNPLTTQYNSNSGFNTGLSINV